MGERDSCINPDGGGHNTLLTVSTPFFATVGACIDADGRDPMGAAQMLIIPSWRPAACSHRVWLGERTRLFTLFHFFHRSSSHLIAKESIFLSLPLRPVPIFEAQRG
jgi:hypothetical protein